jgi:hypothetical protein
MAWCAVGRARYSTAINSTNSKIAEIAGNGVIASKVVVVTIISPSSANKRHGPGLAVDG